MKKTVFAGVLAGALLAFGAPILSAQPIERAVPRSVSDYFEQACAPELARMDASWEAVSMNGPDRYGYYESMSRMSADDVRERFRQYDQLDRRSDTAQERATNEWEDCLLNARLRQLGEPVVARPPQPVPPAPPVTPPVTPPDQTDNDPPPDPGAPAQLVTDDEGRERYVMADGRDCVVIQTGQERVSNGNFNQVLSARNRCNIAIVVRVCAPDGTCVDINALANTTTTMVVGTAAAPVSDFQLTKLEDMGDDGQFGPGPTTEPYQGGGDDVVDNSPIDFGDDSSDWSGNGECDDPRFSGPGAASVLLDDDTFRDASDCRDLLARGQIEFTGYTDRSVDQDSGINFGDDSSDWSGNGECDDPRFSGPDAADVLLEEDMFRDASDCRQALAAGRLEFTGYTPPDNTPNQGNTSEQGNSGGNGGFLDTLIEGARVGTDLLNAYNDVFGDQGTDSGASDEGDGGDGGDYEEEEDDSCGCSGGICTCQ